MSIVDKLSTIINSSVSDFKQKTKKDIHIVDISYSTMKSGNPDLTEQEYKSILKQFGSKFKSVNSLKEAVEIAKDPSSVTGYSAIVEDPKYGNYLVAKSYSIMQARLADTDLDLNVGYTSVQGIPAAKTPLNQKIRNVLARVNLSALPNANKLVNDLYKTELTADLVQTKDFDYTGFNKILGSTSILLTLRTNEQNNEINILEKEISSKINAYVNSAEFLDSVADASFGDEISKAIAGALSNKTPAASKSNSKQKITSSLVDTTKKVSTSKLVLKNIQTNRMIGLPRLLAYINAHLHNVVAANMGGGERRDILNYRTGRFATSTKATRLTMSREGAITVFYDYMKYPYATFSEGGNQQYPRTRDPKRLISRSIREIAAELVSNTLRAELV